MRLYWIWLALCKLSLAEKHAVLACFLEPDKIYAAQKELLSTLPELSEKAVESLCQKDLEEARKIIARCTREGIGILTYQDAAYPSRLKELEDAPLVLYYKGILPDFEDRPVVGVVGTRKASAYGMKTARRLGREIADCGGLVVSGMAAGIDGEATWGALNGQCPAVGVLGGGVDQIFPKSNEDLYRQMERRGCLISEYPPGTPALGYHFPQRNRIISGISHCVLVVEAPEKSGALLTAAHAREHGRDVYAVPGNVDQETCLGSNALLQKGAMGISCGWDILNRYENAYSHRVAFRQTESPVQKSQSVLRDSAAKKPVHPPADLDGRTPAEQAILETLSGEEMHTDDLLAALDFPEQELLSALTMLLLDGTVEEMPGGRLGLGTY